MSETNALIDAAELHARAYDDDDRDCIKTDVINAFFAGAAYQAKRNRAEYGRPSKPPSEWTAIEWKRVRRNQPSRWLIGEEHYLSMLRDFEAIRSKRKNFKGKPDDAERALINLDKQFERFYKLFLD